MAKRNTRAFSNTPEQIRHMHRHRYQWITCCLLTMTITGLFPDAEAAAPRRFDVLLRGGLVVDGSGRPPFRADVGIIAGRVVAVARLDDAGATEVIDVSQRVICPGFIDLHSHADRNILKFRGAENYIRQGVTTLVCGNCGSSPTDVGTFFEQLRARGTGPNIALLVGHASIREQVMGRVNRPPTTEELDEMKRTVREAMQAGAVGLSSGLRYGSGAYAQTAEIVALVKEIAPRGGFYATHMRDEGTQILAALEEALEIGRKAGVPVHVSHHKISSASVFGLTRRTLARIDKARQQGVDVTLDQYPYGAGSGSVGLYVPQSSLAGGLPAFRRRVANARQKASIVLAIEDLLVRKLYEADQSPADPDHTAAALTRIQIARAPHDVKLEGLTLTEILKSRKQPASLHNGALLLIELVARGVRGINHTIDARPGGDVDRVMKHPQTCIASDGGVFRFGEGNPHPRSYGCYPRVLGRYVRDRGLLTLEQAIHKMTGLPARRLGWKDRGLVRPGFQADLTVLDTKKISDRATFLAPHQHSMGVDHVLVRGRFVLKNASMTGQLPGQPVGLGRSGQTRSTD